MAGLGTPGERGPPASVPDALPHQHRLHLSVAQPKLPALLGGRGRVKGQAVVSPTPALLRLHRVTLTSP